MDQATVTDKPTAPLDGANYLDDFRQADDQAAQSDHNEDHTGAGAGGQAKAEPAAERRPVEPYTGKQLAGALAAFSASGVRDRDTYKEKVRDQLADVFDQAAVGEALAELGIGKGGAMDSLPGWLRLAGAAGYAGWVVVQARGEHGRPVTVRPGSPVHRAWSWLTSRLPFFGRGSE